MIISPDYIVYIWLIPLVLFVLLPLSMFVVYLFFRLLQFLFFPKRMREMKVQYGIPEQKMENAL